MEEGEVAALYMPIHPGVGVLELPSFMQAQHMHKEGGARRGYVAVKEHPSTTTGSIELTFTGAN